MNNQTIRKRFQQILNDIIIPEGLSSNEISERLKPISQFIDEHMPAKLFRYRDCSERNVDAFNEDKCFAVPADMFNDPFDTLYSYNQKNIIDSIKFSATREFVSGIQQILKSGQNLPEKLVSLYGKEAIDVFSNNIIQITEGQMDSHKIDPKFINAIRSLLRKVNIVKAYSIACLSEDIHSVAMWSHYANSHKGFALEYDLRGFNFKCEQCDKRNSGCNKWMLANIFPIIYDSKRFDATITALYYLGRELNLNVSNTDITCILKSTLYKSSQWRYEKEWRLLVNRADCNYNDPTPIPLHPQAIYYGNKISPTDKNKLHLIAIQKGIKEYDMCINYNSNRYYMKTNFLRSKSK